MSRPLSETLGCIIAACKPHVVRIHKLPENRVWLTQLCREAIA